MNDSPTKQDEREAISALAGDASAFDAVVAGYERRVFAFLGRMGFDAATAEDLAQDTFVRVWRHRARFDAGRGSLAAWVFSIARNVALTEWRRAGRRPTGQAVDGALEDVASPDDASESLERAERQERLRRALAALSDADRTAIAFSYVDGLSAPEAAALIGCRADAYRTRLSRARRRLAELLETDA